MVIAEKLPNGLYWIWDKKIEAWIIGRWTAASQPTCKPMGRGVMEVIGTDQPLAYEDFTYINPLTEKPPSHPFIKTNRTDWKIFPPRIG